jgi:hypothetical protein
VCLCCESQLDGLPLWCRGTSAEGGRAYMPEICWGSIDGDGSFLATGIGTSDEISPQFQPPSSAPQQGELLDYPQWVL